MYSLVQTKNFIQSTRDSGYKNMSFAIAELVDNSLEAGADCVDIRIKRLMDYLPPKFRIAIMDNGSGMPPRVLRLALQFGGSTRYGSRGSFGRYGMGLPNSSLSQCRHLEVYSWTKPAVVNWNYLDIDEVVDGTYSEIPKSKRRYLSDDYKSDSSSGTIVVWDNIDRMQYQNLKSLEKHLQLVLGRIFRLEIAEGKRIIINNEPIELLDPLYLIKGHNPIGGKQYGKTMKFSVKMDKTKQSNIFVRFVELPVAKWSKLSNKEKRNLGIIKNAGVSVLRKGREIDYGWYFMGKKRKENYDDWWRCEVSFDPELDELFGITHTKQKINPTAKLEEILTPHIESTARKLNKRVVDTFVRLNEESNRPVELKMAEETDHLIEPPDFSDEISSKILLNEQRESGASTLKYDIEFRRIRNSALFEYSYQGSELIVTLNTNHPFYSKILHIMNQPGKVKSDILKSIIYLMVLALARAEILMKPSTMMRSYRLRWGNVLKKYLS